MAHDLLRKRLGQLRTFVDDSLVPGLKVRGDAMREAVTVAHFAKATTTFDGVLLLARYDLGSQVLMLSRPLFELAVNAWWSRLDVAITEERYVGFAQLDWYLRREKARRYPDILGPIDENLEEPSADTVAQLRDRYGSQGQRGWTGLGLRPRMDALRAAQRGPDPDTLLAFYELITYGSNQELHASSWSLARVVRRRAYDDGSERLEYTLAPEAELVEPALRFAWWSYSQVLELVIEEFDIAVQEKFVAIQQRVMRAFD